MNTTMGVLALVAVGGLASGLLLSSTPLVVVGAIALFLCAALAGNATRSGGANGAGCRQ